MPDDIQVFRYIEELDAFVLTEEYARLELLLGMQEWSGAIWVGRLFTLDNDYGERRALVRQLGRA